MASRAREALKRIPGFDAARCDLAELPGGLTNRNVRAEDPGGRRVVVRLSDPGSEVLGVDRDVEHRCALAAAAAGVGPRVLGRFPDLGALVVEWVDGRPLSAGDLDDEAMLARVAACCRRLHHGSPLGRPTDVFDVQAAYLRIVADRGYRLPDGYLERASQVERVRAALRASPEPLVPCHNDLLPANVVDDGARLWLIDFEYAGDNEPGFELGNLWSEADLSVARLRSLVAAYYGAPDPAKMARARLWGLMAQWSWVPWASIQSVTSGVDVDLWAWGLERFARASVVWESPDLDGLLAAVVHGA